MFPGGPAPTVVVGEAPDVTSPAMVAAGRAFERAALASGQMNQPITFVVSPAHTAAIIQVPLAGTGVPRWLRWLPQISPAAPPPTTGRPPRQPVTVA